MKQLTHETKYHDRCFRLPEIFLFCCQQKGQDIAVCMLKCLQDFLEQLSKHPKDSHPTHFQRCSVIKLAILIFFFFEGGGGQTINWENCSINTKGPYIHAAATNDLPIAMKILNNIFNETCAQQENFHYQILVQLNVYIHTYPYSRIF